MKRDRRTVKLLGIAPEFLISLLSIVCIVGANAIVLRESMSLSLSNDFHPSVFSSTDFLSNNITTYLFVSLSILLFFTFSIEFTCRYG